MADQAPAIMSYPPGCMPPLAPMVMTTQQTLPNCPPRLEYLSQIDQLLVHQKVELMEVLLGWETNNQYVVKNSLGQQVFLAAEENNLWTRQLCGPMRSFILHIQNNVGHEVLTLTRPLKCSSCWFPCCLQELEVQAPLGNPLGYVIQEWHPYLPKFTIKNSRKEAVLHIVGSYCHCNCFSDVIFKVTSLDGASVIGKICKQWTGMEAEMFRCRQFCGAVSHGFGCEDQGCYIRRLFPHCKLNLLCYFVLLCILIHMPTIRN